jgi:hypothetical protein
LVNNAAGKREIDFWWLTEPAMKSEVLPTFAIFT